MQIMSQPYGDGGENAGEICPQTQGAGTALTRLTDRRSAVRVCSSSQVKHA